MIILCVDSKSWIPIDVATQLNCNIPMMREGSNGPQYGTFATLFDNNEANLEANWQNLHVFKNDQWVKIWVPKISSEQVELNASVDGVEISKCKVTWYFNPPNPYRNICDFEFPAIYQFFGKSPLKDGYCLIAYRLSYHTRYGESRTELTINYDKRF